MILMGNDRLLGRLVSELSDTLAMLRGPLDIYKGGKFNDEAREIASGPPQIASGSHHNNPQAIIDYKILLQLEIRRDSE